MGPYPDEAEEITSRCILASSLGIARGFDRATPQQMSGGGLVRSSQGFISGSHRMRDMVVAPQGV